MRNGLMPSIAEAMAMPLIPSWSWLSSAVYGNPQRSATGFDIRHAHLRLYGRVHVAGEDRADDGKVYCRVVHFQSTGNIEKYIFLCQFEAYTFFQYGQQRIGEAEKLGFKRFILPKYNMQGLNTKKIKMELIPVRKVEEAFRALFG